MSLQTIEMHFKEIMDLAAGLKDLSNELNNLAQEEILMIIKSVRSEWNSECVDVLLEKEVRLAAGLEEEANQLHIIAEEMESQAKKMYQWEIINTRLAVTRVY